MATARPAVKGVLNGAEVERKISDSQPVAVYVFKTVADPFAGRMTYFKVISGVLPIYSGSVSILGETPSTPAESRALGISTVYQEVLVADESSVVDNIFMGADALFSKTLPQDRKVARAASPPSPASSCGSWRPPPAASPPAPPKNIPSERSAAPMTERQAASTALASSASGSTPARRSMRCRRRMVSRCEMNDARPSLLKRRR